MWQWRTRTVVHRHWFSCLILRYPFFVISGKAILNFCRPQMLCHWKNFIGNFIGRFLVMFHCNENATVPKNCFRLSSYALINRGYFSKIVFSWSNEAHNKTLVSLDTKKLKEFEQHRICGFPKPCWISWE